MVWRDGRLGANVSGLLAWLTAGRGHTNISKRTCQSTLSTIPIQHLMLIECGQEVSLRGIKLTAVLGYSVDKFPWVGPVPFKPHGLYIMAGFHGHGMRWVFSGGELTVVAYLALPML